MEIEKQEIEVYNDLEIELPIAHIAIRKIILSTLNFYKKTSCKINIIAVDDKELKKMKNEYFNKNLFTDVISFLLEDYENYIEGEVYLSPTIIKRNAIDYEQSFMNEFARVVIHGVLHLLGFEDDTKESKTEMTNLENKFLRELNYDI
ncbi:MAG: rRNA maturation RNase YbeY [Candidatus Marinimicrobia bacterium]|nr:rRNA maturation RNase YbeY [Candidatus Neomarinimicrobiota bacterium]